MRASSAKAAVISSEAADITGQTRSASATGRFQTSDSATKAALSATAGPARGRPGPATGSGLEAGIDVTRALVAPARPKPGLQGVEWARLVAQGLTLTSSTLGSFFYLIVGLHALHAIAALCVLVYTWRRLERGWLAQDQLAAAQVFWYFVVGLWPVLYGVVYL